jgi:O-antigen/teichoic acid export membrane protein
LEDLVYNVTVVYFAWRGFGISSFTYAVLLRGVVGVIAIYVLQPWKPGFSLSKTSLKNLLGFGIPYQLNNFLATVKDDGLTIVLGGILGPSALGFLGTAQRASQYPLRFFMDNVTKVTFPAFSRMQDDKEQLARVVGRSVFFICATVFPTLAGLVILFPNILQIIPKYQKWEPAYIPLIFFSANSLIGAFTTQFTNTLNAIGKIKTTFKLMIMWTSLSWLLIPYLAVKGNIIGASLGYFLVSVTSVVAYFILKKLVNFDAFYSIGKPFISSIAMLAVLVVCMRFIEGNNLLTFSALVLLGGATYLLTLYFLTGKVFLEDVKKTFESIINR